MLETILLITERCSRLYILLYRVSFVNFVEPGDAKDMCHKVFDNKSEDFSCNAREVTIFTSSKLIEVVESTSM